MPRHLHRWVGILSLAAAQGLSALSLVQAAENVRLIDVPDYSWYAGCFGTASGNLAGYWDRHGFPNLYTGPTADGVAPLTSNGGNVGIRSLWATKAGFDGRSADEPGHIDDYWRFYLSDGVNSYESTAPDAYWAAGRDEHEPDCICDFIGASQNKWQNLNDECDGNIDAYAVTYWDRTGARRMNYVPPPQGALAVRDLPSGLRAWTRFRGYDCNVFSQLADFNPNIPSGGGFTFADLKREIDSGYPMMLFLQNFHELSRPIANMARANPSVHGMVAFGYFVTDDGQKFVRYRTSWGGSGDNRMRAWNSDPWEADLPVRGVIAYHPLPRITGITRANGAISIRWDGPNSKLLNVTTGAIAAVHRYLVEKSDSLSPGNFLAASEPTADLEATIPNCCEGTTFFRVRLLGP